MQNMSWARLLGNTLFAFATAAIGINIAGEAQAVKAAFYVAAITAILALAKELQEQAKEEEGAENCTTTLKQLLFF